MLFVMVLLTWFILSVPATLVIGRVLTGARRASAISAPAGGVRASREDFARR